LAIGWCVLLGLEGLCWQDRGEMFKGLNPTSDILSINLGELKAAGLEQSA
jgi:hypothetical protein